MVVVLRLTQQHRLLLRGHAHRQGLAPPLSAVVEARNPPTHTLKHTHTHNGQITSRNSRWRQQVGTAV